MIGIAYPFRIANGAVAASSDPAEIALARVTFCVGTQVLERTMRPSWGVELMNVAQALGAGVQEVVEEAVTEAFRAWFPAYTLRQVEVIQKTQDTVSVNVRYGRPDSEFDENAKVGIPVTGGAEIFLGESVY